MIAIENVRLFKELEARTRELAQSVGELRALGEVGQAVSSTLDLQTVLSAIVGHAVQLSGTDSGVIYEYDEGREEFHLRASHRMEDELLEAVRATPSAWVKVPPGERRPPERQSNSNILDEREVRQRESGLLLHGTDIDPFWRFRFSEKGAFWAR